MSEASDLAPLGVDVGRTHAIATQVVLLLVVPKPLCHNALDLSLGFLCAAYRRLGIQLPLRGTYSLLYQRA
jgi:hypothetical protein